MNSNQLYRYIVHSTYLELQYNFSKEQLEDICNTLVISIWSGLDQKEGEEFLQFMKEHFYLCNIKFKNTIINES